MRRIVLLLLVALAPLTASAATAYKCVDAKGAISFQDRPCRAGTKEKQIQLREFAPPPETPAAPAQPEPEYAYDAPDVAPPPPPARMASPKFYLCTRYDGSRYMSDTYQPGSALVPLGVLGVPGRSLADAYGGPNGIGVSAPGLRTIPHQPAASVPFGGMSTWVDDECHLAPPAEACAYLRTSLDDVESKLRRAFSDTQAQLQQQQADLRQRLRGC
jgi:uncharacterized protein DUF4124